MRYINPCFTYLLTYSFSLELTVITVQSTIDFRYIVKTELFVIANYNEHEQMPHFLLKFAH